MRKYELLLSLLPLMYPDFYLQKDQDGNELVFLDIGNHEKDIQIATMDKSQCEAIANHVHLFGRVNMANKAAIERIGLAIAKNLCRTLVQAYPDKRFVVFLQVNINETTIIRFHQIWEGEPLYFDINQSYHDGTEIFEFRS